MTMYNVATSGLQESAEIQVYNNSLVAERDHFLKPGVNPPQYLSYVTFLKRLDPTRSFLKRLDPTCLY